jgi:hypothetical protein
MYDFNYINEPQLPYFLTELGVEIQDFKVDMTLYDEQFELQLMMLERDIDAQRKAISKPFVWDSPIEGEWQYIDIDKREMNEDTHIEHNDNQNLAVTAMQAVIFALKRCDTALQDLGIDDDEFKLMALYCEQSLRSINEVERLW